MKEYIKKILSHFASLVIKKYKPKIIVIIGSVGKTSTREMIYSLLSKKFFVRKNEKSFTNQIGIPLVIIGGGFDGNIFVTWLKNIFVAFKILIKKTKYPNYLILEVDNDKPEDLETIRKIFNPDFVVVTAIGDIPPHVEVFGDKESVVQSYRNYLHSIPNHTKIVFNKDDHYTRILSEEMNRQKIACTINGDGDINADNIVYLYGKVGETTVPTGISCDIGMKNSKQKITIFDSIGYHSQYATLLACGLGVFLNLDFYDNLSVLSKYKVLPGRMRIIQGIKDTTIIDDSYNSSPVAINESLKAFGDLKVSGNKIVVVGDMLELGKYSSEEHKKLASKIKDISDFIICVGIRTKLTKEELLNHGFPKEKLEYFDSSIKAGQFLQTNIQKGDCVFIKGSQSMRMEKTVEEIMRHPEDKKDLLVRQEKEWQDR